MKRLCCTATLIVLALMAIGFSVRPALAYRGGYFEPYNNFAPYFSLSGGAWLPTHTTTLDATLKPTEARYDGGFGVSAAVGMDLGQILRLENELSYRYASGRNGGDTWALGWMVNVWIQARNQSPVTPYFGGGFGLGRGHVVSAGSWDGDMTGVAYQAGGGLDVSLDRRTSLDLGYRYFGISDTGNQSNRGNDLAGSSVMAGVRVRF